jgi:hypothetical protein
VSGVVNRQRWRQHESGAAAARVKAELRRWVLDQVRPARVFEGHFGVGRMHELAWVKAERHFGVDFDFGHGCVRADSLRVMREVDLGGFNVFDFDPYGQPWDHVALLAELRRWAPGEVGALVVTDGGNRAANNAKLSAATLDLLGMSRRPSPTGNRAYVQAHLVAFGEFLRRSGVEARQARRAVGNGGGLGSQRMIYTAVVFEGVMRSG